MPDPNTKPLETTSLLPVTKLNTPSGKLVSANTWARRATAKGVIGDGLTITVFPVTRAAPTGPAVSAIGKLKGDMIDQTP